MQTYAPDDAPRAAPVLAAHCGRSAPGSALARPSCRRSPSPPSRTAPGMHHAPTDAGRIVARRAPGRSIPTRAGLPIRTSARPGTAPPDRPSCGLQMARGHRRHGKPPAGLRRAQRNHASGLRPWLSLPCYRLPSRPAIASPLRPSWHTPPSGACGSPLATVCPPAPPAPLRAPGAKPVRGPASYITRNYPQPVGCPARARIIFVMQNAGPLLRAPARPGCRAAPARTALLVSGSPACHPSAPEGGSPKVGAGATAICG